MTTTLPEVLALLDKATPGEWPSIPSDRFAWDDNKAAIIASVNYLRTHGETLQRALALLEAVESGGAVGAWQPIETAPKDGRYVLLVNQSSGGRPYSGRWCQVDKQWADERECIRIPTHWMPLPAAPAAPGVEG